VENTGTLLLSQEDIKNVIEMKDVIEIVDKTFKGFGEGTIINPTKVNLDLGETAPYPSYLGFMNAMPAYVGWLDSAGIKWAGGFLGERLKLGLPYITSMIMLINPKIGNFTGVMDGAYITNLRTGAQTAIALKYLLDKNNIELGLYGAGVQGHAQVAAISQIFNIEKLKVYDISNEASKIFKNDMKDVIKGEIILTDTAEEVAQCDVVVSVTQSKEKFIKDRWIKPGTILFPMGSYQECEDSFILNAEKIIVDHVGQALHRGALSELNALGKITENSIYATIGELAIGGKKGFVSKNERILCVPIGTGAMDIAVATVALERAKEKGFGKEFIFV